MTNYPTDVYGPAASAPRTSGVIARCKVCGFEWDVWGDSDTMGCPYCHADDRAVTLHNEEPDFGHAVYIS